MEITKIINNNVVSGLDESGRETIWIGTGIGFHYKTEGVFDESIIQKKFHLETQKQYPNLPELRLGFPMGTFRRQRRLSALPTKSCVTGWIAAFTSD